MKITFPDKSYIELIKSDKPNILLLTIVAKDPKIPLSTIASSVEITRSQLEELIRDVIEK
jgi:hypothetical protein